MQYHYHVEDGQASNDYYHSELLGNEGDTIQFTETVAGESYTTAAYILFVDGNYIECIGEIERNFPKNWKEHEEIKKSVKDLHKQGDDRNLITVGEFKQQLELYSDEAILYFSGLDFYRLKLREENYVQVEFNQQVYKDDQGKVVIENLD